MVCDAYMKDVDSLHDFGNIDCVAQADVCPALCKLNRSPTLDIQIPCRDPDFRR